MLCLPCYYVLLPFTDSDYSFCVIFAIVLCPSSVYRFWLLPLSYFCHLLCLSFDYKFCLLLLCYFCHCIMSFFRLQMMITPLVLIMPLYYLLLPFTDYNYSFCVIICHCIISFFRLQILITPFVLYLPLYYVLRLCTDPVYSFCVMFAIAASPSSEYRFWLLLLSYFCHCIMSFFRLQIIITPFVIFCHCIMSFFCL